jgi:hypothetical protein
MSSQDASEDFPLVHSVYWKLADDSPEAREKLMSACRKYLTGHAGTSYFSVATLSSVDRPVSDRDYDVAVHIHFANRAAHDAYQVSERHVTFVNENKPNFKVTRIFDSVVRFDS